MNKISTKIKSLRNARGLSMEELAKQAKITTRTILNIEHGKTKMSEKTMLSFCKVFSVSPNDLYGFK